MAKFILYSRNHLLRSATLTLALGITACATAPEPTPAAPEPIKFEDLKVEVYVPEPISEPEPEPVPSIDIAEYRWMQMEREAAARAAEEAMMPTPEPEPEPVVVLTLEQRLASAKSPNRKIAILNKESASNKTKSLLKAAYVEKLAADRANNNASGAAKALVYLGKLDAAGGSRDNNMTALSKYAEALKLDPGNAEAPRLVSKIRGSLQGYADTLHKEAVTYFVRQNFAPAVERWEKVLLIDPGNNAARNWYDQASKAIGR